MYNDLIQQISNLKQKNQKLNVRITELETRLNKNSNNSSKPPSSDGLKKKPRNSRKKSGKFTGGQLGHEGRTLEKIENPDKIIDLHPHQCECGCDLSDIEGIIRTRQVFELPVIKIKVIEYKTHEIEYPKCKRIHKTKFPKTVTQPVQYGENLQAAMVYLTNYQLFPLERAAEIIEDLTGHNISQGTLVNTSKRVEKSLEGFENSIKEQLKNANVVHDHWKPYYTFTNCTHAECNAHHIRNLKGIYENYGHE